MMNICTVLYPLLLVVAEFEGMGIRTRDCPSPCHCEEEGMLLRVDCSDLGLTALPSNLSSFTSSLDLSMNGLTHLPVGGFSSLHFLEELRLAGNALTHIPKGAFSGLFSLRMLMLQNNQLGQVPSEGLQNLPGLQSLRLDANHIYSVPPGCFHGLAALRHLWLDDNALTEVPVQALGSLPSLQAMTLALNRIAHIPDFAFTNLSRLVVLHLHNNKIHSLGEKCFDGLQSLETLDLNYNNLDDFPMAIQALTNLKELYFYDNPIQFVCKSAFQNLPQLRTLSLNGAMKITEFPDLTGTRSLESLTITGAHITSLPRALCDQLPNLQVLDLSYNWIQHLPSFRGCRKIQRIDLNHNQITEVLADTFQDLTALRSLDLSWNKLHLVHAHAFSSLPSFIKLDLTSNLLTSVPVTGLSGLTYLKLAGNEGLKQLLPAENFPKLRVMEMPYAFQCCAFVSDKGSPDCWGREENATGKQRGRKEAGAMASPEDHDLEDFLLDLEEEPKAHRGTRCSPAPGPFHPCSHLFESWLVRCCVWLVVVLSLVCNALVALTVFLSALPTSPAKHLVGLLALANSLMGLSSGALAVLDALTFGAFARYGPWWQSGAGCKVTGFVSVFSSEACVFLLTAAALEQGLALRRPQRWEAELRPGGTKATSALCFVLSLAITALPLLNIGEYGLSSLCLPLPHGEPSALGFMVALVLLNSLCYLVMAITYTRLYCSLEKGVPESFWDGSMTRHVAWLLFANCLLYFPAALLSLCSLLKLPVVSPDLVKSVLLVAVPLPACLNPLLYVLFNPHFREDFGSLLRWAALPGKHRRTSLASLSSEDAEKQSCDSTRALVALTPSDRSEGTSLRPGAELCLHSASFGPRC